MLFTLREQFLDTFFFETGLSQTEVPRRLSIVRLLMVLSSVCFFFDCKNKPNSRNLYFTNFGNSFIFSGFYPFVLEGLNAARLRS